MIWRVRGRSTFDALRQSRRRASAGPLRVSYVDNTAHQVPPVNPASTARTREPVEVHPQVAYAITKRVGCAAERNRLRRRLRAAASLAESDLRPGAYLVSAFPEARELGFEELGRALHRAMHLASAEKR